MGGHLWTPLSIPDPWNEPKAKYYLSKIGGNSNTRFTAKGSYTISNGYNRKESKGRTVVLHQFNGTRIGCGVLD